MNRVLPFILGLIVLLSGCDSPVGFNIFSALKNTDNISVTEAIASGDEDVMTAVYNRESAKLASLDPDTQTADFIEVSLGIADLQAARSKAVFLFLALISISVTDSEVAEVIVSKVIENYLREVTEAVRSVLDYNGSPSATQTFISILGLVVWWYYVAEDLGLNVSDMIEEYNSGTISGYLGTVNVEADSSYYESEAELTNELAEDVQYMSDYLDLILTDEQIEQLPDLEQAVINVQALYNLGS